MPERPVILFPSPEKADCDKKTSVFQRINRPQFNQQYRRLKPTFRVLQEAFSNKTVQVQQSPVGLNPEFALVFEIVGNVSNFYTAVQHSEGLEWLFDLDSEEIEPDDVFYKTENESRVEEKLGGKLYCVMSNKNALDQLIALWKRHAAGEIDVFPRGLAGLRDVFVHIKNIRKWSAKDRLEETGILDFWRQSLNDENETQVPFELELFYRHDKEKQKIAAMTVRNEVGKLGGTVIQECILSEIAYHAMLIKLPRIAIENLVKQYDTIELAQVDDIMFFRPGCQSANISFAVTEQLDKNQVIWPMPDGTPIAAILDGMPLQNHPLLQGRIIIDDPDDYANNYQAKHRIHGTGMASLAIYGDLSKNDSPVRHKIYVRPILKPKEIAPDEFLEFIPKSVLLVDVLHRAVKRIKEGENGELPVAPDVQIINLSIGDPARQLTDVMSPSARILDYMSYKYKLLFIISAGNHPECLDFIQTSFQDMKARSMPQRNEVFWNAIKAQQRNLRLLAPAESINGLTIGATYDDYSNVVENPRTLLVVGKGMPSPISAIGKGYRGIIAPDVLYNGGRKFAVSGVLPGHTSPLRWQKTNKAPGCKVAAPYNNGTEAGQAYSFGTSDAAAQITHEAINCYDVLSQVFYDELTSSIPQDYAAIFLKCMLAHGASWESFVSELSRITGVDDKNLSKWAGYGVPNIERVKECTKERITLIGYGTLKKDQGDCFKLPLHVDFSARRVKRKLTVTLAYFSPVIAEKQAYRAAQLWFDLDDKGKKLFPGGSRQNNEWQTVRKGTLQHEIFCGEQSVVWNNDDLVIKVNCKEDAGKLGMKEIPYCIFVSFEVAEGLGIDLYTIVKTQIKQRIAMT